MINNIKVSVISPLYNKKQYVDDTISSVLSQTYLNWELIIVDDGSTDGGYEMVADKVLNLKDNRIKLLKRDVYTSNKGGSVCRNIGLNNATGDYVIFLDSDDILKNTCLETRLKAAEKHPGYGFYVFYVIEFKKTIANLTPKSVKYNIDKFRSIFVRDQREYYIKRFLTYDLPWSTCDTFWHIDSIKKIHGFHESFQRLQDPEVHSRALLQDEITFKILKYTTEYDSYFRIDEDRKASITKIEMFDKVFFSLEHFINFFTDYLERNNKQRYLKYLTCYLFLVEQMYVGYSRNTLSEEMLFYKSRYENVLNNANVAKIVDSRYVKYLRTYKMLNGSKFARKLQLHSLLVYFYKLTI